MVVHQLGLVCDVIARSTSHTCGSDHTHKVFVIQQGVQDLLVLLISHRCDDKPKHIRVSVPRLTYFWICITCADVVLQVVGGVGVGGGTAVLRG